MSEVRLLQTQFKLAHDWTLRLVQDLDEDYWTQTPEGLKTNINWQLGHIVVSLYFHALVCTGGSREEMKEKLPLSSYIKAYQMGSSPEEGLAEKPGKRDLLTAIQLAAKAITDRLSSLKDEQLEEPVEVKHPVAKTKREVLVWCTHHQMWHNGQISMLKRLLVGKSF